MTYNEKWTNALKKPMKKCLNCGKSMGLLSGCLKWCKHSCKLEYKRLAKQATA